MSSQLLEAPTAGAEADPVGRIDREIIGQVDLDRATALIERRSSSALLEELAGIVQALEVAQVQTVARRSGIVGRLLGRDMPAQARARQAHEHIRIRLQLAERRAQEVIVHLRELDDAIVHVVRQRMRLAQAAERGRDARGAFALESGGLPDAMERRLGHLAMLVSSWDVAVAHMRLVRQYDELLLARYAHVRDVVVPQWRRDADAALHADGAEGTPTDAPLRDALASLLQSTSPGAAVFPTAQDVRV